jgi:hypothetical protein
VGGRVRTFALAARTPVSGTLTLLGVLALAARPLHAEERALTSTLEWTAPQNPRCPSREWLVDAVETRLGRSVFVEPEQADVRLSGRLARSSQGYVVDLSLRDDKNKELGTRHIESRSADCGALRDTLPVVLALLVDVNLMHQTLALPEPAYAPPPAREESGDAGPAAPRARSGAGVGLSGELSGLYWPELTGGAHLQAWLESPRGWRAGVWLLGLAPVETSAAERTRLSLFAAGLEPCRRLHSGALGAYACAGAGLGRRSARGRGFELNERAGTLHVEARAGLRLELGLGGSLRALIEAGAVAPLTRDRYVGESAPGRRTELAEIPQLAPRLAIGLGRVREGSSGE